MHQRKREFPRLVPRNPAGMPPPMDLDAEAAVLSAILLSRDALDRVLEILRPEHFFSDSNGRIYEGVLALSAEGKPVDILTVASWLRDRERMAQIGGAKYLALLADATPAHTHVEAHARIVLEKWRLRQLIATCQKVAAEGYGDVGDADQFINAAVDALEAIQEDRGEAEPETLGHAVEVVYKNFADPAPERGAFGPSTGLIALDYRLGGLGPGDVTVIGARPSMGKTALARHLGDAVAAQNQGVAFFSVETPKAKLSQIWALTKAGIDKAKLRNRELMTPPDWTRMTAAASELQHAPIWIDHTPGLTLQQLRAKARRIKTIARRRGVELKLLVVDYLQLMNGATLCSRNAQREEVVAAMSREVKRLAGELDVHVALLSQINRSVESRSVQNKRPTLSDLRESGAIEADADNALLLYRDEYYHPGSKDAGVCEIIVAKQRDGKRGVTVKARFVDWCTRFEDLTYDDRDPRCPD